MSIDGPPTLSETVPPSEVRDEQRINILIVDDEPKNLTVLETILDDPTYRLVRAESADQALLALVAQEFALLILDIRMPGMTGFELAQMIRDRKKTAGVPIIFLTAYYNEDQHVLEGYDTGAVDYLHKPVKPAILRSKVAVFVELYRMNREIGITNQALMAEVVERRRAEEELRALNESLERRVAERTAALSDNDRRKDEFLATLAHELRNPLAPMRSAVQIMALGDNENSERRMARDVIVRQIQLMTRLIDDLIDLSRVSQGKISLKRTHIELAQLVENAVETSRPLIAESGHELIVALPPKPITLYADPDRVAQVLLNLLNNAAKFSEPGSRIYLSARQENKDLVLSVRDQGVGLAADSLLTIFEMFSQVESALSRTRGGLGIGLCLVKQLVEMHSGTVEARSEGLNRGSEFEVRMPIILEQPTVPPSRNYDDAANPLPTSKHRILVVDDNFDAANTLTILLKLMGNTVSMAHDGEMAIETAEDFLPDVILCDIGLPKLSGYDVARAVRQRPWAQNVKMIALTGWSQDSDRRQSAEAGFDQHMVKPITPAVLMKLLADLPSTR